jgi:alpha-tubulin suppressor-like RCC1 family protein
MFGGLCCCVEGGGSRVPRLLTRELNMDAGVSCSAPCEGPCFRGRCIRMTQLALGTAHSCALGDEGSIWCWGDNRWGALGSNLLRTSAIPVRATGVPDAVSIAAQESGTCVVKTDGSVWCWGWLSAGAEVTLPHQVQNVQHARTIAGGAFHMCALLSERSISCWGDSFFGETGVGVAAGGAAIPWSGVRDVTSLAAGRALTCFAVQGGNVQCAGQNRDAQRGTGGASSSVSSSTLADVLGLHGVVRVVSRLAHVCALREDGSVSCWGNNDRGQLGDGTTSNRGTPIAVAGIEHAQDVAVGETHSCALLLGGTVSCWGNNEYGQLGDGTFDGHLAPRSVNGLRNVVSITSGLNHTCATTRDGSVWCWGRGTEGQIGDGQLRNVPNPARVYWQ